MNDFNDNGLSDKIDNLNYFLISVIPPLVFLLGVLIVTIGIFKEKDSYQKGGAGLTGLGGLGTGTNLIKKPTK